MIFERENCKTITNPSAKVISRELKRLKSYGNSSFASLTYEETNSSYIQVAGGAYLCMLEKRDNKNGIHYRAWQEKPIVPYKDGTELSFSGSSIALNANEWFNIDQVIETFIKYLSNEQDPFYIHWRDITNLLS